MDRNIAYSLIIVAWFALLALVEVRTEQRESKPVGHEADARLITNFSLTAIGLAAGTLLPVANVGSAAFAQGLGIGLARQWSLGWGASFALVLLAFSFVAYWLHRWMHRIPFFWRIHRVHHADSVVDISTSLRNHPFELLVTLPVSALVVVAIGAPPSAVVAAQTAILASAIWQHADIRLPKGLDRALGLILFTPGLHRLHHSPERAVHDTNYGDIFTIWDRLFGTLNLRAERGAVGLDHQRARADHLLDQICSPLRAV